MMSSGRLDGSVEGSNAVEVIECASPITPPQSSGVGPESVDRGESIDGQRENQVQEENHPH